VWDKFVHTFIIRHEPTRGSFGFELCNTTLDNYPVNEYVTRIKALVDCLHVDGESITLRENMDAILEGLPQELDLVISLVESCVGEIIIEVAESLILAQELCFKKYRKNHSIDTTFLPLFNLSHTSSQT